MIYFATRFVEQTAESENVLSAFATIREIIELLKTQINVYHGIFSHIYRIS